MKKLTTIAAALAAAVLPLSAQENLTQNVVYPAFNSIKVTGNFEVTIKDAPEYCVDFDATAACNGTFKANVEKGCLVFTVDQANFDKAAKAAGKGIKNFTPLLRATISMPVSDLTEISLSDESSFSIMGQIVPASKLVVNLDGKAVVKRIDANCQTLTLNITDKAIANITTNARTTTVNASKDANSTLSIDSGLLTVNAEGKASTIVNGNFDKAELNVANSSSTKLEGSCKRLSIEGKKGNVDASTLSLDDADVNLNGTTVRVAAKEDLKINVENSAYLVIFNNPKLELVKVKDSSVLRPSDDKKKK